MKYLFKALLKDGTVISQTQEDVSATTKDRNAFYDVLQKIDEVRAFALYDTESPDNDEYLVDLADGHFEINQKPFFMHNENVHNLRLIFFKRNLHALNLMDSTSRLVSIGYNFGFQGTDDAGNNVQRIMTLF